MYCFTAFLHWFSFACVLRRQKCRTNSHGVYVCVPLNSVLQCCIISTIPYLAGCGVLSPPATSWSWWCICATVTWKNYKKTCAGFQVINTNWSNLYCCQLIVAIKSSRRGHKVWWYVVIFQCTLVLDLPVSSPHPALLFRSLKAPVR